MKIKSSSNLLKRILKNNNKGASLVIIIAVMALFMVLAMNILMAANVTSNNMSNEYDSDKINLYISSVFRIIDEKICSNEIPGAFEGAGKTIEEANVITLNGFTYNNKKCDVEASAVKFGSNYGEIYYIISLDGTDYYLTGRYSLSKAGKTTIIVSEGCSGIELAK